MEEEQRLIHEFNNNILEFNGEFRHIKRKAYLFSQKTLRCRKLRWSSEPFGHLEINFQRECRVIQVSKYIEYCVSDARLLIVHIYL
jgi:hypothetical protein